MRTCVRNETNLGPDLRSSLLEGGDSRIFRQEKALLVFIRMFAKSEGPAPGPAPVPTENRRCGPSSDITGALRDRLLILASTCPPWLRRPQSGGLCGCDSPAAACQVDASGNPVY